jgi:hypothetical protein
MTDEAAALQAAWMSAADFGESAPEAIERILEKDRAERARERRMRTGGALMMMGLVPVLVWAAAHGVAPVIRGAYALMAVGCVAGGVAEWLYLVWSRRALPGPDDTRSQLQRTAFLLEWQRWLVLTAGLWSSPVFAGVLLICVWLYRERTPAGAVALAAVSVATWIVTGLVAARMAAALERRRRALQEALADL